jgi:hypothetical protein
MCASDWPMRSPKLTNYEPGILADDNAPGCVLEQLTRAPDGTVPLWGQNGTFGIECASMRVRIEIDGFFGIASRHSSWVGFAAHAVDWDKPFLSDTGYRSFLGVGGPLAPGYTPEAFAKGIVTTYVQSALNGRCARSSGSSAPKRVPHVLVVIAQHAQMPNSPRYHKANLVLSTDG